MGKGWQASSGIARCGRSGVVLALVLALLAGGCGSVALCVKQPVGAQVEVREKGKWLGAFGPDWLTGWNVVVDQKIAAAEPVEMELEAYTSWLDELITLFPRRYRARFDLSTMELAPKTPTDLVEIRYVRDDIPEKYQHIIQMWHAGKTLDVLTNLPLGVLADVLYNLGGNFTRLMKEVDRKVVEKAAKDFGEMVQNAKAGNPPTPKEVESWLKSFLSVEQLGEILGWVRDGIHLESVRWVPLGGLPVQKDAPLFWKLVFGVVDLVIRQPEVRTTKVNLFEDVILRHLLARTTRIKLVRLSTLKFYAEFITYDTTYYSDRAIPAIDLIQASGLAKIADTTAEQEAELQRFGMTSSVAAPKGKEKPTMVTSLRSQILGALIEGEMAYVVVWNNPQKRDPVRYLTTLITTGPYGMARVWAMRGDMELCEFSGAFEEREAPITELVSWIVSLVDQRRLFVQLEKPVAVIAFGRRRIAPWSERPRE